jgi:glycosyltransferase involved in cell wall biosynthesis
MTAGPSEVSVIVPMFNAASTIERSVEAILAQDYPAARFEVIVVDNGSTDGGRTILTRYASRIRVITEETRGAAAARNAGARCARFPYLAFTDADCVPDSTWLTELVGFAGANEWADFVGGRIVAYQPRSGVARFAETLMDQKRAVCEYRPPYAITANLLLRGDSLRTLGMFDESLRRGQDVDLSFRGYFQHGCRFGYAERAVVGHVNPSTVTQLFRKGLQHGDAVAAIYGKYATELGATPWHRCADRRVYAAIGRYLGRSMALACLQAVRPTQARRARILEAFCEAVFRTGKQAGLLGGTVRRARRRHDGAGRRAWSDRGKEPVRDG